MEKTFLSRQRAIRLALLLLLTGATGAANHITAQDVPEGAIAGLFTVNSEGGKVYFSQGNLQYQATTDTWRFAENQYDFCGAANNSISETFPGWFDLFGWGTSGHPHGAVCYQPWSLATVESSYKAYGNANANLEDQTGEADWGCNAIINGGNEANQWRTLTHDEWVYLLNTRYTYSGMRYAKATVNDIKGLLLLPNNWNPSTYALNNANTANAYYNSNIITEEDWTDILSPSGVVFLPASGNRYGNMTNNFSKPNYQYAYGCYWSSTHYNNEEAWYFQFSNATLNPVYRSPRYMGFAVRLVTDTETLTYNIEAEPNPADGGTVSGYGVYDAGDVCTLTAIANEGYTFGNWTLDDEEVSTEATFSFTVSGDAAYVANFLINSYEITALAEPEIGGTLSGAGTYNHFDTCMLIATASEGYSFISWTKDDETVSTDAAYTFIVTEDAEYVAHFNETRYEITVTANPQEGGEVSGAGIYEPGATVTLTAQPNVGYSFINWTKDGAEVSGLPTYSFTAVENANLVANFQFTGFIITVLANPNAGGIVTGQGIYEEGEECTLTAAANEGYSFVKWIKNGAEVATSPELTFTVDENAFYIACFRLDQGIVQTTTFDLGWTWWNTFIETNGDSQVLNQLETGLGDNGRTIKSQESGSRVYLGNNTWFGSIVMTNEYGYMVNTLTETEVSITGLLVDPTEHQINLNPNWTWIGYPSMEEMTIADALAGFTPQNGDVLKSQNKSTVYLINRWFGELESIRPGMGLMYNSRRSESVSFILGIPTRGVTPKAEVEKHWNADCHAYPENMTILAVVELDGEELASTDYELAAFANGECRGSARLTYVEPLNRYMAILTVSGEEAVELSFGLYDSRTGEECLDSDNMLTYSTNAVTGSLDHPFVVSFRGLTGMDELGSDLHVFPNPVARGEAVNLGMKVRNGNVQVEVVNAMGAVVSSETLTKVTSIAAPDVPGVYTLRISVEGEGTCFRKLVVR